MPVSIIMTGLLFSGLLGTVLQKEVDTENQGTELYDLSQKDFYQKPSSWSLSLNFYSALVKNPIWIDQSCIPQNGLFGSILHTPHLTLTGVF